MSLHDRQAAQSRHYGRSATKKRFSLRPPKHPGYIAAVVLAVVAVITLALVWGSHLKAKSDAYRTDKEADRWLLDAETATPLMPVSVPEAHLLEIKPEGNVGDILIQNSHDGVILPLSDAMGTLSYRSAVGETAGRTVGTVALPEDVARVKRRGLRVSGVYTVTCFAAETAAEFIYLRGVELAILREFAESGIDDILILGLPAEDTRTPDFLLDLKSSLADMEKAPAIGAAITLDTLSAGMTDADGQIIYAGDPAAARLRRGCDYLALDLRAATPEGLVKLLPRLQYAYVRHTLRLMVDKDVPAAADALLSHGFVRVFEMTVGMTKPEQETE